MSKKHWCQTIATVIEHDYTEERRINDTFESHGASDNGALVNMQVSFTDEKGNKHISSHCRHIVTGLSVDPQYTIWYLRDDPSKTTDRGPISWVGGIFGALAAFGVTMLIK